jgi:hypothetical protein
MPASPNRGPLWATSQNNATQRDGVQRSILSGEGTHCTALTNQLFFDDISLGTGEDDPDEMFVIGANGGNTERVAPTGSLTFGSHGSRGPSMFRSARKLSESSLFGSIKSLLGSQSSKKAGVSFARSMRSLGGSQRFNLGHLSPAEYSLIEESLKKNFMFKSLSDTILHGLILAFGRIEATRGDNIVRQGDTCEDGYVYVIGKGLCSVLVDDNPVPGPFGTLAPRSMFGELGGKK